MSTAPEVISKEEIEEPFPSSPAPIRIINSVDEGTFKLNVELLSHILLDPQYANKKVALISVAGAYRRGKSFILNFFLRYLNWLEQGQPTDDWLSSDVRLDGFSWRGGQQRDTQGMLLWSRPFVLKNRNGEDVVVLLMDTQGAFDSLSTVKDCATIFALSTMLSSVQIYNINGNVQEDDLQHLEFFTDYGRLALEGSEGKPFQTLLFLVRDWSYCYDFEYGFDGGRQLLEERLHPAGGQRPQLKTLRERISQSFESLHCFLMPHPGLKVATNKHFRGELSEIESDFQSMLRVLVPRLFDPNYLTVKAINGEDIKCRDLLEYFRMYVSVFHGDDVPEPKSMLEATAEANNLAAAANSKALYVQRMEEVCGGDSPYLNTDMLTREHDTCLNAAIESFRKKRKMGGESFSEKYLEKLNTDIAEQFVYFTKANDSKNLFKSLRTPAVLVLLMVIDYFLQEMFQAFGLEGVAGIFTSVFFIATVSLGAWVYVRYSGSGREAGEMIDKGATFVWEHAFSHIFLPGAQAGLRVAAKVSDQKKRR